MPCITLQVVIRVTKLGAPMQLGTGVYPRRSTSVVNDLIDIRDENQYKLTLCLTHLFSQLINPLSATILASFLPCLFHSLIQLRSRTHERRVATRMVAFSHPSTASNNFPNVRLRYRH
jgi:hypothetical protein